jgi:phenylacetate-CoA ligase
LLEIQQTKFKNFINFTNENSKYYKKVWKNIDNIDNINCLNTLPIITKEKLRSNINDVYTVSSTKSILSKTGGTTGKSLEVRYTRKDMQERFAMLDAFRNNYGYKLGKKTAWFSGKNILTIKDLYRNRFWKTDWFYKVRYYSTFHISSKSINYYINDLIFFRPEYIVGFPSNLYEIAKYGLNKGITFPSCIKAIFPTAETVTSESRKTIEKFFKTKIYNQYASSEGAPFIFECESGSLHLELQSGVFEVLDNNNQPAMQGRLVVTSFTTHGTPLVRYDIGDEISLSSLICDCGNNNPIVSEIFGRTDDYVYSKEFGKINLGNISNTLKGVQGIKTFQVIQNSLDTILILIVKDLDNFRSIDQQRFINNWKDRLGDKVKIEINFVKHISVEKSGKFRLVKNNIKHLINE